MGDGESDSEDDCGLKVGRFWTFGARWEEGRGIGEWLRLFATDEELGAPKRSSHILSYDTQWPSI